MQWSMTGRRFLFAGLCLDSGLSLGRAREKSFRFFPEIPSPIGGSEAFYLVRGLIREPHDDRSRQHHTQSAPAGVEASRTMTDHANTIPNPRQQAAHDDRSRHQPPVRAGSPRRGASSPRWHPRRAGIRGGGADEWSMAARNFPSTGLRLVLGTLSAVSRERSFRFFPEILSPIGALEAFT